MVEVRTRDLKKKLQKCCTERVLVILHPTLHRALKLMYPTDVGGIVLDVRITTEMGTGNLGQSVGVFQPQISVQSVTTGINLKNVSQNSDF